MNNIIQECITRRRIVELLLKYPKREFVKSLLAVSAVAGTAGLSGCLEYIKPKTPEPTHIEN